jgi:hypothetical protein
MNYPVVMVTATASQLEISQQRYLLDMNATDPGTHPSPFGYVHLVVCNAQFVH